MKLWTIVRIRIHTRSTFNASSHTCIPLDSNTSTQPKYLTENEQVADRTACSSDCH